VTTLLTVENLSAGYERGAETLHEVSLEVRTGQVVSIIGPNGAGKSTVLRAIFGMTPWRTGSIHFEGAEVLGVRTHEMLSRGVAFIAQGQNIFPELSVARNLEIGAYIRKDRHTVRQDIEAVYEKYPALVPLRNRVAGLLSGGQVRMLEIARALLVRPKLILVDEPSLGLSPLMSAQVFKDLGALKKEGISILIVEQNAEASLRMSEYAYVIEGGRNGMQGPADRMRTDAAVRMAYLGA